MTDLIEIKKSRARPAFRKGISVKKQDAEDYKKSENGFTEIKIITHNDDFDALEQIWNELAWKSDTHIFQTYEWNRIWWKHFGTNKKLHIVTVFTGNKLAGIAPLFEDDVALLGRKVYSCLRFLGSYVIQPEGVPLMGGIPYSDYLDCIIHPGNENIFYKRILSYFNEIKSDYDEIILDEVSEESVMYSSMIPLIMSDTYGLSYKIKPVFTSPVIQLDSTWDAYLDSLSVKDRYNARRYYKRSEKGNKNAFKIEKIKRLGNLPGAMANLIRMHQLQWNSRGFAGTFSEKRMRNFFMEVAKSFFEKDWIEFNMAMPAEADIKCVAVDMLLTYKNRVYLMHRGMDEDPQYRKQGPGNVLLYARLNEAIHDGVKVFDMLRGSEEFKVRMATKINQINQIIICSGNQSGRLMTAMVKKYMKMIHHVRIEKLRIKLMFGGKSFFKGISEYIRLMHMRIKHKLLN